MPVDRIFMRVVLCVVLLLSAAVAHAQGAGEPRWLFVPVSTGELPARTPPAALTAAWEAAMRSEGEQVIANESAGSLVEARHSSEAIRVDNKRLQELVRIVDKGQQKLSRSQRQEAQDALQAVSDPEREFMLRDPALAQKLFDVCMMTAAILVGEKKSAEAATHVNECAESFPGFFPPKRKGPPALQDLVARVQKQHQQEPSGTLSVTSEPPGCAVRLNGGVVGTTPATIANVAVGIVHVQIECDPQTPGRTHAMTIGVGDNRLAVDAILEAALHTRDGLWLSFASDDTRRRQARGVGQSLAHVLGDPRVVLLVLEGGGDNMIVRAVPLFASEAALKPVHWQTIGGDDIALRANVRALRGAFPQPQKPSPPPVPTRLGPELVEATPEVSTQPEGGLQSTPIVQHSSWPSIVAGASATVVGVASIAFAWAAYAQRQPLRLELRAVVDPTTRADFDARGTWVIGAGAIGSIALTAAVPFLLPKASNVRTWAWVIGGLGVAVVGTGIGYSIFERHCAPAAGVTESGCRRFTADGTFGPLVSLHGLPLLGVPATYLIRQWQQPSSGIQLGLEGGVFSVRGSF